MSPRVEATSTHHIFLSSSKNGFNVVIAKSGFDWSTPLPKRVSGKEIGVRKCLGFSTYVCMNIMKICLIIWKKNGGKPTTTQPASTPLNTNRKIDPKDTCVPLILCCVREAKQLSCGPLPSKARQGKPCHCVFCQIGLHRLGSGPSSCSVVWCCTSCCMMLYIVCMGSFLVLLKSNVAAANRLQFCTKNVSPGWKTQ